jgi:hypothetical protein
MAGYETPDTVLCNPKGKVLVGEPVSALKRKAHGRCPKLHFHAFVLMINGIWACWKEATLSIWTLGIETL